MEKRQKIPSQDDDWTRVVRKPAQHEHSLKRIKFAECLENQRTEKHREGEEDMMNDDKTAEASLAVCISQQVSISLKCDVTW